MPNGIVLAVANATVRYGETTALRDVSVAFHAGTVHALIGENGAGKSTLLRLLAGMAQLDAGTITTAPGVRIEWVPQDLVLAPDLTVAESIFLGREWRRPTRLLRRGEMQRAAGAALARIGCTASPAARVGELAAPVRKQVQLARAFSAVPGVLLLDEPTAVLGEQERTTLIRSIRQARDSGAAIVYVSHQIDEVLALADTVTVLRDGQHVSTDPVSAVDAATVVTRMVGRQLAPTAQRARARLAEHVGLRVSRLSAPPLHDISLEVGAGEVVGLAGLVGAGRSELLACIAGARPRSEGEIEVHGTVALVPEDRVRNGLVDSLSLRENIFLPAPSCWLHAGRERAAANRWIEWLRIRTPGGDVLPSALSGGNQQKVLLARALRREPDVLLLDEPTAGVDIGAKADIHEIVRSRADAGAAVLIASSELPELLALCDRIVALRQGEQVATLEIGDATESRLAALITGAA